MEQYNGSQIVVLEGLEAVRKRPGMYIGSTGSRGLHHLIWEILDNGIDEHLGGYCNRIEIELQKDGGISVTDNGRGFRLTFIRPSTFRRHASFIQFCMQAESSEAAHIRFPAVCTA